MTEASMPQTMLSAAGQVKTQNGPGAGLNTTLVVAAGCEASTHQPGRAGKEVNKELLARRAGKSTDRYFSSNLTSTSTKAG
mgnify:CR=1 FL=1